MRNLWIFVLLALVAGCGGDDNAGTPAADAPTLMQAFVRASASQLVKGLGSFDSMLPLLSNLGSPGAAGVQFELDTGPGAPPNAYLFSIPLDGDGDGTIETSVTGRAVLTGDPASPSAGFGANVELQVESEGGFGDFSGTLDLLLTADGTQVSGTGTCTDETDGNTTQLTVDPTQPLLLRIATGDANAVANACGYSLDGAVDVEVTGPSGFLGAVWNFVSSQASAHVTDATYRDSEGEETNLPDADVIIPCGGGRIQDWAGVYSQDYSCLPPEFGEARLTITVTGQNTLQISDEDPPGSGDTNTYAATALPGNPHVVRGHFISGPVGFTYREDFSWTLTENGQTFSQVSVYEYQEGPNQGGGGICSAQARRQP